MPTFHVQTQIFTRDNLFALDDAGRSALQTAKLCAGRTALCIIFATQGGPPSNQQNSAQGGPPCASYKLHRAVRPPTRKMVCRADCPMHHISYTGQRSPPSYQQNSVQGSPPFASYDLYRVVQVIIEYLDLK